MDTPTPATPSPNGRPHRNIYQIIGKRDGSRILWSEIPEHTTVILPGDVILFDDCLGKSVYEVRANYGKPMRLWASPDEYQDHVECLLMDTRP